MEGLNTRTHVQFIQSGDLRSCTRNAVESLQSANRINEQRDFQFSTLTSTRFFIIYFSLFSVCVVASSRTYMNIWAIKIRYEYYYYYYSGCILRLASLVVRCFGAVQCAAQHWEFICQEIALFSTSSSSFQAPQWLRRRCLLFSFPFSQSPQAAGRFCIENAHFSFDNGMNRHVQHVHDERFSMGFHCSCADVRGLI